MEGSAEESEGEEAGRRRSVGQRVITQSSKDKEQASQHSGISSKRPGDQIYRETTSVLKLIVPCVLSTHSAPRPSFGGRGGRGRDTQRTTFSRSELPVDRRGLTCRRYEGGLGLVKWESDGT